MAQVLIPEATINLLLKFKEINRILQDKSFENPQIDIGL